MFSEEDVQTVFRLLPPAKQAQEGSEQLPPLFLSSRGHGCITRKHLLDQFKRLATKETHRMHTSVVSHQLDVDIDTVLQLVREHSHLALLSEDRLSVIMKEQRDSIERHFRDLVTESIVSKAAFSKDHNVSMESIDALTHDKESRLHDDLLEIDDHLLTKAYQQTLQEAMKEGLDLSLKNAETLELTSQTLPGEPPIWYISRNLQQLLVETAMGPQFHIAEKAGIVYCTPRQSILQKRDAKIAELQSGSHAYIDLQSFAKEFGELYSSYRDVQDQFATLPTIFLAGTSAISEAWLSKLADECVRELEANGSVELTSEIEPAFPADIQNEIVDKLERRVRTTYEQKSDPKLHRTGTYILTTRKYDSVCDELSQSAKAQATGKWEELKETADKDLKFQISDILAAIPSDRPLLRAVTEEKGTDRVMEEHFWSEISVLESQNEEAFSAFWIERVLSRVHNYREGLQAIEDGKLRDQLADLLSAHLQKELFSDALAKARSQGLVRSRKTRKNAQKLESALAEGKADLKSAVAAMEKFGKKQGVQEPDPASLVEAKKALTGDMIRRMQKPKTEPPVMFLTLIIVLFARQYPGIVYATGKFAPKLLKLLKSTLSAEQYERLEHWKEQAKAGTLTAEDREDMRQMAGEG